ncbi:MAG: 1-acyl-sn-glycerol-3-phosphate acyltransferase [Burkholderiales bacterium]|nr:1-acyl-sn-glycerol-3-phosphate acyltransferase [Burkholderiales bacterium]MDP2398922.1 1-acyl-sn-glycerol-3-phosphate acyltransferase [Burkholderiales bacterium]
MSDAEDLGTTMAVADLQVGPAVPRRAYGPLALIGRLVLRAMRWRAEGCFPDSSRLVVAIAPHSSGWDFVIGAAFLFTLGLRVSFIAKHTLFFWPLGPFLRWLGGIPVNRARPEDLADAMAAEFGRRGQLWLAITPEGTRTPGARFKSGFYRIAKAAGVQVLPVYFNYRRRVTGFLPLVETGGEVAAGVEAVHQQLLQHGARRDQ